MHIALQIWAKNENKGLKTMQIELAEIGEKMEDKNKTKKQVK